MFRVIFALLTVTVMTCIFILSAENAAQSSQTSSGLIEKVVETFVPQYNEMSVADKKSFISSLEDIVRNAAHFSIFGALGICVSGFAATFNAKVWLKLIFCQLFCSLYAVSDEYHQTFSEGRSCQLIDVFIDSSGSFVGIVVVLLIVFIYFKIRNKGGIRLRKHQLIKQIEALKDKLFEADNYIKQLTDLIADKDCEIRKLNDKLSNTQTNLCDGQISNDQTVDIEESIEQEEQTEPSINEYHDFDFAVSAVPENNDDVSTYAVKAISRIVTESVKIGCVLASSENENKKELLNLALGRTEVAKNEISALVNAEFEADLIKASIDKECALVMEYYQSILSQL